MSTAFVWEWNGSEKDRLPDVTAYDRRGDCKSRRGWYRCTADKGHDPPHLAGGIGCLIAIWKD